MHGVTNFPELSFGRFVVEPFLNPGLYILEVATATAADQPVSVREVIGKQGERLQGPRANRDAGGPALRYTTTFQVGVAANPELDRTALEHAKISNTKWWKRQCRDICDNAERFERDHGRGFSPSNCLNTCITNPPTVTH